MGTVKIAILKVAITVEEKQ